MIPQVIRTPNDEAELTELLIDQKLLALNTLIPGEIKTYDAATRSCSVQPLFQKRIIPDPENEPDGVLLTMPVLKNVRVQFPTGGGFTMTWPLAPGDEVKIEFAQRNLEKWVETGGIVDPADTRKHHLSDAVVVPGLTSKKNAKPAHADDLVLQTEDGSAEFHIEPGGKIRAASDELEIGSDGDAMLIIKPDDVKLAGSTSTEPFIKGTTAKIELQLMVNMLQSLQTIFTSWTPVPLDGGSALKVALLPFLSLPLANLASILSSVIKGR